MGTTLELYDGDSTIDFTGSVYRALVPIGFGPPPKSLSLAGGELRGILYKPRSISFPLTIIGSSVSDLRSKIRDLDIMIAKAQFRQSLDQGTKIVLKTQLGDTNADDIEYRVLAGSYSFPGYSEPEITAGFAALDGSVTLLCDPLGRLANVTPSVGTLENEVDGSNLCYLDLQSLTGSEQGRFELKIHDTNNGGGNAWNGSKKVWIARRGGERRTDTLFFQQPDRITAGTTPRVSGGIVSFASASSGPGNSSAGTASEAQQGSSGTPNAVLTEDRTNCGQFEYDIAGGSLPRGLFRVLARVAVDADSIVFGTIVEEEMGFALSWAYGALTQTSTDTDDQMMTASIGFDTWETLDLGEIVIPPAGDPTNFTAPTLTIKIDCILDMTGAAQLDGGTGTIEWHIDYVFLLPIDEGAVLVNSIGTDDRVLIDTLSDSPGVYLLNTSNIVQQMADFVGGPFNIGPEDTRIYVLRDDTGDPTTTQFTVTPVYTPQVLGM